MDSKRCEKVCTLMRMEAVFNSRNELIRQQDGIRANEETIQSEELLKAYDNLEESYVDIIIAEAKYLESLKEKPVDIQESDSEKIKKMVDDYWKK
jgi:hypothetical protein